MVTKRSGLICLVVAAVLLVAVVGQPLLSGGPVRAAPGLHYVAPGGSCGAASPCYPKVQDAVDAAQAGDEIRVAAGTYSGINNLGGKPQHLYVNKDLTIKGGYTTSNWTTPDPAANVTEWQAQTLGRVVFVEQNVSLTLDGLSLTYGNATGLGGGITPSGSKDAGGGVFVYNGALTLKNCQVLHNSTPTGGAGGGLYAGESTVRIENSLFQENISEDGGGIYLYHADSTVKASQFISNQASGLITVGPFAVGVAEGTLLFTDNTVDANLSAQAGSAVGLSETSFTMTKNRITGTSAGSKNNSGISISNSTGLFAENYVANHRNKGVSVFAGYVTMIDNEVAYNEGWPADVGGGVSFNATTLSTSRFVMNGNHIHHNTDRYLGQGGGVNISASETNPAYLYYNLIEDNLSGDGTGALTADGNGGGAYLAGDYVTLVGNTIRRNTANGITAGNVNSGGAGGGVYINGSPTLINNIITANQALFAGSGVYVNGSTPNLHHNTIVHNVFSGGDGSGVFSAESFSNVPGQPRLYNNIIVDQPVGVYADKGDVTSLALVDGVLWYGNGQNTGGSGTAFVNNEYTGDPLFVDPASGDYHISSGSPAIDKGIAASAASDMDREPRLDVPDLGADEYWAPGALKRLYLPLALRQP
jgi:hypothetical protein